MAANVHFPGRYLERPLPKSQRLAAQEARERERSEQEKIKHKIFAPKNFDHLDNELCRKWIEGLALKDTTYTPKEKKAVARKWVGNGEALSHMSTEELVGVLGPAGSFVSLVRWEYIEQDDMSPECVLCPWEMV